jgi:tetratricopeptide (TPR) repeat protein
MATMVDPRLSRADTGEKGFLAQFMGEGRKLFANQFFTRSDVYFHSGYYPSVFDEAAAHDNHLVEGAGSREAARARHEPDEEHGDKEHGGHEEEHDFLGKPKDLMDAFTRHFIVSEHSHLTDKGPNAEKEILPWLKLSAQLDPSKVESYTVAAYWLRDLGKKAEAEQFLREGLRHNPRSYDILYELGRCYYERSDLDRARNLWELAITCWREQENTKPVNQQNRFMAEQILNHLAQLEARAGNRERAASWLGIVKKISPHPDEIEKRIEEVLEGKLLDTP